VVAPGANAPYAAGAEAALHRRGIVAVPDFLSNSGGVHLYESVRPHDEPTAALATIEERVHADVTRILGASAEAGSTPMAAALADARSYLRETTRASAEHLDALFGRGE
jgi:glutamate dehydrogenase/leucine dehydrogenase